MAIQRILGTDSGKVAFEKTDSNFQEMIDSGSNANGRYLRFADGTQICYGDYSETITTQESDKAHWAISSNHPYAATFVGRPNVMISALLSEFIGAGIRDVFSDSFTCACYTRVALTDRAVVFYYTATGRWK